MILQVKNAVKTFSGITAVDNVSFTVNQGEIFGIAGPNGSGKSTLFNLITGIPFRPTAGEIIFNGVPIHKSRPENIAHMGLLRTFQKNAIYPDLTVYETLELSRLYGGGQTTHITEILHKVQLPKTCWHMLSSEISVYASKQLMIASALICGPKVLMLDEPASGLTKPEIQQLSALLLHLKSDGITIVLVEHVLSLLLTVSDRLLAINQGQVITIGTPEAVIKNPQVIEAYLGGES